MNWFDVVKSRFSPQTIENQETKEATIDWIKRNRSITLIGHKFINKRIRKINSLNNEKFPLLVSLEPYPNHPIIENTWLRPESLVDETSEDIRKHNERTLHLLSWLGSDENTHRIVTGDLV